MNTIETPYGVISWTDDVLGEDTIITINRTTADGGLFVDSMPLSRMIAMTNGDILPYLPDHPDAIVTPLGVA